MSLPYKRKIGPKVRAQETPTSGPTERALKELAAQGLTLPDLQNMYENRLARTAEQLQSRGIGGILLFDPINIRYATGSTNMQVWTARNLSRAAFVSAAGLYHFVGFCAVRAFDGSSSAYQ